MKLPKIFSTSKSDFKKEIGGPGTSNYQGYIDSDYNPKLDGQVGIDVYNEMRKSDSVVGASLMVMKLPILGTKWFVEPASNDEEDVDIASFVESNLMEIVEDTWSSFLRQTLLMLPYGVMVFEKVYQNVEWNGQTKMGLKKLAPRLPDSIYRWETSSGGEGMTQLKNDGNSVSIPMDKLVVFVLNKEGSNWWGRSILRQAYKPWFLKQRVSKIDAISLERQGIGIPMITLPEGHKIDDEEKAETLVKNLRAHEKSFLVLPSPEWKAEFMDMNAKGTRDPDVFIQRQDREIMLNTLSQFLQLGAAGSSGSWSLSKDQSQLFLISLEAIANNIKDTINNSVIKQLVRFNFDVNRYPTLEYGELGTVDWTKLSSAIKSLYDSDSIRPDDRLRSRLREIMGLPDEEETEETKEEPVGEKEEEEKKETSEYKEKRFSNTEYWRELTFAERKVDLERVESFLDNAQDDFVEVASKHLEKIKDNYFKRLEDYSKDFSAIDDIGNLELPYKAEYAKKIYDEMQEAYTFGKVQVANEMNIPVPTNRQKDLNRLRLQADIIANKHYQDLEFQTKNNLLEGFKKNVALSETVKDVAKAYDEQAKRLVVDTANITAGAGMNQGRRGVIERNDEMIYALQRSEILDRRTCNYCVSIDGRVVEKNDPFADNDIFHGSCRGMWVEILIDEAEKPPIKGIPDSLESRFGGTVNKLIQPQKPIVSENSLASQFLNK